MNGRCLQRGVASVLAAGALALGAAQGFDADRTPTFAAGCAQGPRLTIAAAGDLLFHKLLQLQAYAKGGNAAPRLPVHCPTREAVVQPAQQGGETGVDAR